MDILLGWRGVWVEKFRRVFPKAKGEIDLTTWRANEAWRNAGKQNYNYS